MSEEIKKYVVTKALPSAPIGTDIKESKFLNKSVCLTTLEGEPVIFGRYLINKALAEGFIEETKAPEKNPWRSEDCGEYWFTGIDDVSNSMEDYSEIDNIRYTIGNYFKYASTAHLARIAAADLFRHLHDPTMDSYSTMDTAISKAREAVLKDDGVEQ